MQLSIPNFPAWDLEAATIAWPRTTAIGPPVAVRPPPVAVRPRDYQLWNKIKLHKGMFHKHWITFALLKVFSPFFKLFNPQVNKKLKTHFSKLAAYFPASSRRCETFVIKAQQKAPIWRQEKASDRESTLIYSRNEILTSKKQSCYPGICMSGRIFTKNFQKENFTRSTQSPFLMKKLEIVETGYSSRSTKA